MGLEAATLIHQLDVNNPVGGTDQVLQGDDHLRMIKTCLRNSFPNFAGVLNSSHAQIDAAVTAVAALPTFGFGEHVPVATATINCSGASAVQKYLRIGNIVLVGFRALCTNTASGILTELRLTLPVASNIGLLTDLFGHCDCAADGLLNEGAGIVHADTAADRAIVQFIPFDSGASCVVNGFYVYKVI